jgi:hypothetical protein
MSVFPSVAIKKGPMKPWLAPIPMLSLRKRTGLKAIPLPFDHRTFAMDDRDGWILNGPLPKSSSWRRIFAAADTRPLTPSDISAANRKHDQILAHSPWFRLWQRYGICCRTESPIIQLGERES